MVGSRDPVSGPPPPFHPPSRTHEVTVLQLQAPEYRRVSGLYPIVAYCSRIHSGIVQNEGADVT